MKRIIRTGFIAILALLALSCSRFEEEAPARRHYLPDGTPVMLNISFGSSEMVELNVGTRAESSAADESRIHDLYVMIFDNSTLQNGSPKKIYGRYFSFEHLASDLSSLDSNPNEGWWVENKTLPGITPAVTTTAGAVKISTTVCSNALLVVLGNVTNAVSSMSDDPDLDDIAYLNGIATLDELRGTKITLEQDVVNRKDLFLMMGTMGKIGPSDAEHSTLNTHDMIWGETPKEYNSTYKLLLQPLDAKVKFMVRCNRDNIDAEKAVYWTVCSTPDKCYLFGDYNAGAAPDDAVFFDSESAYFESTEVADDPGYSDWYVFTFYTLENKQARKKHATAYHDREKQIKTDTGNGGYEWWTLNGNQREYHSGNYVSNGKWEYANDLATYVKFDMVLTLNSAGIYAATGETVNNALTTDTIFTIHLGDFGSSGNQDVSAFDDYNTLRSHFYTYKITIDNSGSVYAEVENDNERQPGQEGYLLLTNDEIVNADAHYEYHSVSFGYSQDWDPSIFSWYVKTPFGQGEPKKTTETVGGRTYPLYSADGLDYKWVMFGVNEPDDPDTPTEYSHNRLKYPGIGEYDSSWKPSLGTPAPKLMDINQLIEYLFDQKVRKENDEPNDFLQDTIRVTIFIDEYYYDKNPLNNDPSAEADPDLWRRFVNAEPREMHILSDARKSRDKKSDVIVSSHSIIQQSIQTIYNTYAPGLRSLWGTEHKDEIKEKVPAGWHYWPADCPLGAVRYGADSDVGRENGRLNTAYIWNVYNSQGNSGTDQTDKQWTTYMNFAVDNDTPELNSEFQGMAFSCLTRNRDNNGDGIIDRDEVRWYMASTRQLIGMWVGNESLSLSARLYQPAEGQWRAHVVSSTKQLVCWAEEGAGATPLEKDWGQSAVYGTWATEDEAAAGESVRCLRNIGTYDGASGVTDITYAPYKQEIDKYFEIETEGSGVDETTTFYFDRLNTKSIREYTEGELPYHPQTSLNNRVYVKMTAQPLSSQVDEFEGIWSADFNPAITASGSNPYCPAGWRLPNQTEYVLMSLYMPQSYFLKDASGNNYGSTIVMPSRTYYDRGKYGDLRQESGPWSSEKYKIGFGYSTSSKKTFCIGGQNQSGNPTDEKIKRTRCVRDDKMTGTITGDLLLNDDTIYPQDWTSIIFNFSSVASAFTYASVKLCYNTHNGNYREWDLPLDKMPSGLQYRDTLKAIIPSLATLGLDADNLPIQITLQAQVRNLAGQTETKSANLTMDLPTGKKVTVDFPSKYNVTNGVPVRVKMAVGGHSVRFTGATLEWQESGAGSWNSYPITGFDADFDRSYSEEIYLKTLFDAAGNTDFSTGAFKGKRYNYRFVVTSSDGHTEFSPVRSMEIIKYNYSPNADGAEYNGVYHTWTDPWWQTFENANAWYNSLPSSGTYANFRQKGIINNTWPGQQITNLDFSEGDFIEADIDVTNCVFIRTVHGKLSDTSPKNNTVGMDNILGIGPTGTGWIAGALQVYYPAHSPAEEGSAATPSDKIQFDALYTTSDYSKIQAGEVPGYVNIVLDSSGVKWNGTQQTNLGNANQSTVVPNLVTRNSLYIGAEEGNHYSRATYNYVRVIRNRKM